MKSGPILRPFLSYHMKWKFTTVPQWRIHHPHLHCLYVFRRPWSLLWPFCIPHLCLQITSILLRPRTISNHCRTSANYRPCSERKKLLLDLFHHQSGDVRHLVIIKHLQKSGRGQGNAKNPAKRLSLRKMMTAYKFRISMMNSMGLLGMMVGFPLQLKRTISTMS